MPRVSFRAVLSAAATAIGGRSAAAQGLAPGQAPIDIHATPSIAAARDTIVLAGSTVVGGKPADIRITVQPPQGSPVTLTAHASGEGSFASRFGATSRTGTYRVTATAIDGQGTATDSFSIVTLSGMVDRQAAALTDLYNALTEANTALTAIAQATPPSPPREKALDQFHQLADQVKEAPGRVSTYRKAMGEIAKAVEQQPILWPPLRPAFDSLNERIDSIEEHTITVRQQVANCNYGGGARTGRGV